MDHSESYHPLKNMKISLKNNWELGAYVSISWSKLTGGELPIVTHSPISGIVNERLLLNIYYKSLSQY